MMTNDEEISRITNNYRIGELNCMDYDLSDAADKIDECLYALEDSVIKSLWTEPEMAEMVKNLTEARTRLALVDEKIAKQSRALSGCV